MTELDSGLRVLSLDDPVLTPAAVARLAPALATAHERPDTVIDCSRVVALTPAGLTALLELGRSTGEAPQLALAGLSRSLTLAAVQAGLAAHFAIYANAAAFAHASRRAENSPCAP